MIKCCKRNYKKIIALLIIFAIGFAIWKDPITSKANGSSVDSNETSDNQNKFVIDLEDGSYLEYEISEDKTKCTYYQVIGVDENGQNIYQEKVGEAPILAEDDVCEEDIANQVNSMPKRGGTGPLYWQKVVKDKLKRDYFYQPGVKGDEFYYKIGNKQKYVINYSKITNKQYVNEYVKLIDDVNKEITRCFVVAVGAVLLAISTIMATYTAIGTSLCGAAIVNILDKVGVTLVQITPITFAQMVYGIAENYAKMDTAFAMAATYGIIEN